MKAQIIRIALKAIYKGFLRGWIVVKIDDPDKTWDDKTMKALDQLFD